MTQKELESIKIKDTIFLNRPCGKCNGKLYIDRDSFGSYIKCINCGYEKDIELPTTQEKQDWGIK